MTGLEISLDVAIAFVVGLIVHGLVYGYLQMSHEVD